MAKFIIELETKEEAWLLESLAMYSMIELAPDFARLTPEELTTLKAKKAKQLREFLADPSSDPVVQALSLAMYKLTGDALNRLRTEPKTVN